MEIQHLRRENETLREGGAVGGVSVNSNLNNRHVARDLRLAASSAENNLRYQNNFRINFFFIVKYISYN